MKIAVIGTNFITERLLTAAARNPEFELAAVCASSKAKAEAFAAPYGDVPTFGDYRELLTLPQLDGVYIATPNQLHHPMTLFFLEAGIPVLCEKPLAVTHKQAEEMVALSRKTGTLLVEGIVPLFIPNFQAIRDTLPEIGSVHTA
ncbi:MAG: Gfo/Idh/MocA family oxidoreductase, partial [Angelakisella sp.]